MFYKGIVEDNNDPMKLGRVRVRIWGLHTENKLVPNSVDYMPVEDLPWALPIYPAHAPSISQEGIFGVPEKGSIVLIMFLDAKKQQPFYLGTIPHIEELPDYTKGFNDPTKEYPLKNTLGEPSTSRLARNEKISETIIKEKKKPISNCQAFEEPTTEYNAKYPYNRVFQSKCKEGETGHVIEIDDTPGAERIHIWHKKGTNIEIYPDGKIVIKSVSDNVEITKGDKNEKVEGTKRIEIDKDFNIKVSGAVKIESEKDITLKSSKKISILAPVIDCPNCP